MSLWQFAVVTVHIFSVVNWVGGAIFLALVMVPVVRGMEPSHTGLPFLRRFSSSISCVGVSKGIGFGTTVGYLFQRAPKCGARVSLMQ